MCAKYKYDGNETQFSGSRSCNCINNVGQDEGFLRGKNEFPLREVRFGDTGDSDEWLYYTLGPLRCVVGKVVSYNGNHIFNQGSF